MGRQHPVGGRGHDRDDRARQDDGREDGQGHSGPRRPGRLARLLTVESAVDPDELVGLAARRCWTLVGAAVPPIDPGTIGGPPNPFTPPVWYLLACALPSPPAGVASKLIQP